MKIHSFSSLQPLANGFTLVEILVGSVIFAVATAGAAALIASGTLTRTATTRNDLRDARIDDDIARIQELARLYTRCQGLNKFTTTACQRTTPAGTTVDINPGNEDYYSVDCTIGNANCASFRTACVNGTIAGSLSAEIAAQIPQAQLNAADLQRVVGTDDAAEHRLSITYNSTLPDAQIIRRVLITPPLAYWCPA